MIASCLPRRRVQQQVRPGDAMRLQRPPGAPLPGEASIRIPRPHHHVAPVQCDRGDGPPDQAGRQRTADGLDFREFGHGWSLVERGVTEWRPHPPGA
jgi:hypothetical protein